MQKAQKGFTLIELVVVIVLLGILGVTALGKFQNLSGQAADAAEQGIAGEISSASAINFATRTLTPAAATAIANATCNGAAGIPSATLNSLMASGAAPTTNYTYAFAGSTDGLADGDACTAGQSFLCSVTNSQGAVAGGANASVICIP